MSGEPVLRLSLTEWSGMEESNLERSRESMVSFSSIMSIAGMTVAKFGVEREKKRVASFNI